ncbi:hypothetical protein HUJ04_007936 [Dendroctonus ponderosae]
MANISYCLLISLTLLVVSSSGANKCLKADPCLCSLDDYFFIDISQVSSGPVFLEDRLGNFSYFFAGCQDREFKSTDYQLFTNTTLKGVSLVKCERHIETQVNATTFFVKDTCTSIGDAKDIVFDLLPNANSHTNEYQVVFKGSQPPTKSSPTIQLACSSYNRTDLKVLNTVSDVLILYSPLVCIQQIAHHELSTGSIFCVIFFVAALTYFVGGGLIMYFARGARGVEVIPNFDFWASIPGLVKDGLVYVLSGCRPFTVATAESYDRI